MKPLRIFGLLIILALLCGIQALAAGTTPPIETSITVQNNMTGTPDEITVNELMTGDIVKVYASATSPVPVGVAVASGTSATVYVNQLGPEAGSVYVTVTRSPNAESDRTAKNYDGEDRTPSPAPTDITVQNNVSGTLDVITVENLNAGDYVRVYQNAVGNVVLAATKVTSGNTAVLYVNQLGTNNGTVYVTVQGTGRLESLRTAASYTTELTQPMTADKFEVTVRFYKEDSGEQIEDTEDLVLVKGLEVGDRVRLYKNTTATEIWADVTANSDGDLEIKISQLPPKGGVLYASITKPGKAESKLTAVRFGAEPITPKPLAKNIQVANNYGTNMDHVICENVPADYTVRVYKTDKDTVHIAEEKSPSDGATVTLTLDSGHLQKGGGKIYVTYTAPDKNESDKTAVTYGPEQLTQKLRPEDITVENKFGSANDKVTVNGLADGYIVRIYDSQTNGNLLASGVAEGPTLEFTGITWQLPAGGRIYVSVESDAAHESVRVAKVYDAEAFTPPPSAKNIKVTNNYNKPGTYNKPDTVEVSGIKKDDIVRIYSAAKGGELIAESGKAESDGAITVTIPENKLLAGGGKIYVTVTSDQANESTRTPVSYGSEPKAPAPSSAVIKVDNFIGTENDVMTVAGLNPTDVVKVYVSASAKQELASASPGEGGTSVEIPLNTLSAAGGKLFVTVTTEEARESARTPVTYESEKSAPLTAGPTGVTVANNNYPAQDVVTVRNLKQGDIITIYRAASGEPFVGPLPPAGSDGDMEIHIEQLGVPAGKIYITVTSANKTESVRTPIPYPEEQKTESLHPSAIEVQNNYQMDDTITITGVTVGYTVYVYTTATSGPPIAEATATVSTVKITIDNGILAASGGKVFVSVKNPDLHESNRTPVAYTSEVSAAPAANKILVVNYPGEYQDTVTIIGLSPGDIVTVYNQVSGGEILAQETVVGKGTTVTLTAKLQVNGGTIFVSVRGDGKAESKRTAVKYDAQ